MKHAKLAMTLLFLFLGMNILQAQNYNMTNGGSISTCSGTFYDSGGNGGSYSGSENLTYTICPDNGGKLTADFTFFDSENSWDMLTIYDGNSTAAPTLGSYTGTAGPGFVAATTSNTSGCLTFVFTSDGSVNNAGWSANIACTQPCQDIIANAIFSPAPDGDGIIRICQGTAVTMNGTGVYPDNNTSYAQSDATSTFTWSTQDGPAIVGQSVTHTYTTEGAYIVQLEIEDVQGCSNANDIDQEIRVSTTPNFSGTIGSPDPICLGEQASFNGVVTPVTYEKTCDQPNFPPISLPDGSGVSYETSVNIDCYGATQTVTNISDIVSICLDIEHSYLGDLDIVIECPNGQTVSLKDYPGGSNTFLGEPVDDDGQPTVQGVGYNYCFDPTATNGTLVANGTGGVSLPAGSYESANSMGGLIGCDLNGDWTLIITDHMGSDNGFIFDWSLNFDPAILPPAITFTPTIVTEGWQADPTIVGGTNPITVEPTSTGNACYTFEVTDNFGCDYDTTVCITVDPSPVIDPVADVTQCSPYTLPAITGVNLTGNEAYYTGMNGTGTQYNPGDVISATTTLYIYDRATVAPFCENETSFTITIINAVLTMNCPPALTAVCDISEQPAYANFAAFQAAGGSASTTGGASVLPATFTLLSEVSDGNTCPEVITRTYQIEDDCGNTETCTQTITINDIIPPTGTAPADLTVQCIGDVPAANVALITDEADNCTVTPTVTHVSDVSDGNTCPEVITRTYRITDDCGNSTDVVQTITIDDNTNPTGTAPADLTVQCIGDVPAADVTLITDEADNCTANPIVTHVSDVSDGNTCPEVITRTYN
ncbi:PKD domain-containing protein, partial [Brumimicrobium sp.]|uniref:PKD domain-containing protein n=1 Tax=Brumimicrobium sp. TaxID=2029867 RepID=UPI003A9288F2